MKLKNLFQLWRNRNLIVVDASKYEIVINRKSLSFHQKEVLKAVPAAGGGAYIFSAVEEINFQGQYIYVNDWVLRGYIDAFSYEKVLERLRNGEIVVPGNIFFEKDEFDSEWVDIMRQKLMVHNYDCNRIGEYLVDGEYYMPLLDCSSGWFHKSGLRRSSDGNIISYVTFEEGLKI